MTNPAYARKHRIRVALRRFGRLRPSFTSRGKMIRVPPGEEEFPGPGVKRITSQVTTSVLESPPWVTYFCGGETTS